VSLKKWGWEEDVPHGQGGPKEQMGLWKGCGPRKRRSPRKKCVHEEMLLKKRRYRGKRWAREEDGAMKRM